MPVLSFMLFISSRFENMWDPSGLGVAGFLSGMELANSDRNILMAHPFVVMLKPAVAMSAQPNETVIIVSLMETFLFLAIGLWMWILVMAGIAVLVLLSILFSKVVDFFCYRNDNIMICLESDLQLLRPSMGQKKYFESQKEKNKNETAVFAGG